MKTTYSFRVDSKDDFESFLREVPSDSFLISAECIPRLDNPSSYSVEIYCQQSLPTVQEAMRRATGGQVMLETLRETPACENDSLQETDLLRIHNSAK